MIHKLKTIQPYYEMVEVGVKTFEIRKNDRPFSVGDIMILQEYGCLSKTFTGKEINTIITYILNNPEFCKEGFVTIGFKKL